MKHAGKLMLRCQVGRDGRTAKELHAGKPCRRQLVEFGLSVFHADSTKSCKTSEIGSQVARASEIAVMRCGSW